MDKIHINGISCLAHLGVPHEEREIPQEIQIDVVLTLDLKKAIHSDEVTSTVNYSGVVEKVQETVAERRFSLLETVAGRLCSAILTDTRIKSVQVRVRKFPEALRDKLNYVEVQLSRER